MNRDRLNLFEKKFGVRAADRIQDAVKGADLVLFAVKPQNMERVFSQMKGHTAKDTVMLSIVAGLPISEFENALGSDYVCRCMPNTVSSDEER